MRRVVSLTRSSGPASAGYHVRLGPLAFVCPVENVSEELGGTLEAVGAAIAEGDPRPPALGLKLPIRGGLELDPAIAGRRLRRQVRALLNNVRWRAHGLYLSWDADAELDAWLRVGGGTIEELDPGVVFGEFELELRDVYLVGRPGTHRAGRRLDLLDRRGGVVPRDTRRFLYSADFAATPLPAEPAILPGDTVDLVASGNRPVGSTTAGPLRGARRLWRSSSGVNGETLTYLPDEAVLPDRDRFLELDELGAVRVWDRGTFADIAQPSTTERDADPDVYLGWERVLGDLLEPNRPLAIDNGAVRLLWLGPAAAQGLAVEWWDDAIGRYRRAGRIVHATGVREARVVELTAERAVLEWRAGEKALRAILQRGWWGPRLESYNDGGGDADLAYTVEHGGFGSITTDPTGSVWDVDAGYIHRVARATADTLRPVAGATVTFRRPRVCVVQMSYPPGPTAAALASLALVDAQAVPILVGRR